MPCFAASELGVHCLHNKSPKQVHVLSLKRVNGKWECRDCHNFQLSTIYFTGSADGFEGCLKDIKIQDQDVDWFNLSQTVNIYKTACPVT